LTPALGASNSDNKIICLFFINPKQPDRFTSLSSCQVSYSKKMNIKNKILKCTWKNQTRFHKDKLKSYTDCYSCDGFFKECKRYIPVKYEVRK